MGFKYNGANIRFSINIYKNCGQSLYRNNLNTINNYFNKLDFAFISLILQQKIKIIILSWTTE